MAKELDKKILQGLKPEASLAERVAALTRCGLSRSIILEAMDVSYSSLRNWEYGRAKPRRESVRRLDDLRFVMSILVLYKEMEPAQASQWLQSRESEPPFDRPADIIADLPEKVIERALSLGEMAMAHEQLTLLDQ